MKTQEMKELARNISPRTKMTAFDQPDPECKIAENMAEILKNTGYDKESGDTIGSRSSVMNLEEMKILTSDPDGLLIVLCLLLRKKFLKTARYQQLLLLLTTIDCFYLVGQEPSLCKYLSRYF